MHYILEQSLGVSNQSLDIRGNVGTLAVPGINTGGHFSEGGTDTHGNGSDRSFSYSAFRHWQVISSVDHGTISWECQRPS